jgi:hypothetical protein
LTGVAVQHGSDTIICTLTFSDEIVPCYKEPAELLLFHDVEMKSEIWEGKHPLEVRAFEDRSW